MRCTVRTHAHYNTNFSWGKFSWSEVQSRNSWKYCATKIWSHTVLVQAFAVQECINIEPTFSIRYGFQARNDRNSAILIQYYAVQCWNDIESSAILLCMYFPHIKIKIHTIIHLYCTYMQCTWGTYIWSVGRAPMHGIKELFNLPPLVFKAKHLL